MQVHCDNCGIILCIQALLQPNILPWQMIQNDFNLIYDKAVIAKALLPLANSHLLPHEKTSRWANTHDTNSPQLTPTGACQRPNWTWAGQVLNMRYNHGKNIPTTPLLPSNICNLCKWYYRVWSFSSQRDVSLNELVPLLTSQTWLIELVPLWLKINQSGKLSVGIFHEQTLTHCVQSLFK